ncbi:MAG: hypothetical protein EA350_02450 [Gemmatimonadales bacterium]|nr:MAG: hypothetical protein EA350_02450 [Gemmatimonadales bacterium]
MRSRGRLSLGVLALLALMAGVPALSGPLAAQAPGNVLWETRHQQTGVGLSVHFPAGSSSDPAGGEGTAFLFGRTLEAEGGRILTSMGGRVQVDVGLSHMTVTMFAPAREWASAWREISALLSGTPFPETTVRAARDRLVDQLMFEAGAPVRRFDVEWNRLRLRGLLPGGADVALPVSGSIQGVSGATAGSLEDWRRRNIVWPDAVVAVVGPVSEADVRMGSASVQSVGGVVPTTRPDAPGSPGAGASPTSPTEQDTVAAPLPPAPVRIGSPAPRMALPAGSTRHPWDRGERRIVDEDVTSTWIGVAWPIPAGTPLVLRDFLSHVLSHALNPIPPDPGLYRADVRLEQTGGTSLLIVEATVDPRAAVEWESRILETVAGVAGAPTPGAFFDLARRRYRSARLLEAADPAARARWIATRWAQEGRVPQISSESWGLSREGLGALAGALGEPRILIYGPERMMSPP